MTYYEVDGYRAWRVKRITINGKQHSPRLGSMFLYWSVPDAGKWISEIDDFEKEVQRFNVRHIQRIEWY